MKKSIVKTLITATAALGAVLAIKGLLRAEQFQAADLNLRFKKRQAALYGPNSG